MRIGQRTHLLLIMIERVMIGRLPDLDRERRLAVDFAGLAEGMGCDAVRVTKSSELAPALTGALANPGASLVEVMVDSAVPLLYAQKG
jgi:thiamine pyrophosphate-dependent acetolactate synthase large subunit-like protein